ncbi:MAG: cation transporter [Clostridia bacterium]
MSAGASGSGQESRLVLRVEGMSCSHCRAAVERALFSVPGVRSAEVDLKAGTVKVTFDPAKATRDEMVKAVEEEGYRVPS